MPCAPDGQEFASSLSTRTSASRRRTTKAYGVRTSELVLLLNSDTIVPEGSLDRLIAALRELPNASIVGPKIVDGAGRTELSYGRMMTPLTELRQKLLLRYASPSRLAAMTSRTLRVDWVTAACLLVRRRDAEAAGLLDERYFMYCEDVDFCAAVRANGGTRVLHPARTNRPPPRPLVGSSLRRVG